MWQPLRFVLELRNHLFLPLPLIHRLVGVLSEAEGSRRVRDERKIPCRKSVMGRCDATMQWRADVEKEVDGEDEATHLK